MTGARASLKDNPLPVLDLTLDGVSNFLAGDPERRRLAPGGEPLRGLGALADVLAGDPDKEPQPLATRIRLEIDALDHPVLLWPIEQLSAEVALAPEGVRVEELHGDLGGCTDSRRGRVHASIPNARARVQLVSSAPISEPPVARGTAAGRRDASRSIAWTTRVWSHEHASGRFTANAARFDFDHVEATLAPTGRVAGTARLDFAHTGSVPYRVSFTHRGRRRARPREAARAAGGRRDRADRSRGLLRGEPRARAYPARRISAACSPRARATARSAACCPRWWRSRSRAVPSIRSPDASRSATTAPRRFSSSARGSMHTEAFSIDGPDLRVFASGNLSLASPTHEVDAHVVLFLFRQIDNLIGKIPVLNLLLLGSNENLLAAYYDLSGPVGRARRQARAAALARHGAGDPRARRPAVPRAQEPPGDRSARRRARIRAGAAVLGRTSSAAEGLVVD